jgi:hypothetical protein
MERIDPDITVDDQSPTRVLASRAVTPFITGEIAILSG